MDIPSRPSGIIWKSLRDPDSKLREIFPRIAVSLLFILFLIVWEFAASHGWIRTLFFPAPSVIAETLANWVITNELGSIVLPTLNRMYQGFVFGGIAGILLGILIGRIRFIYNLVEPIISFLYPIPKIAVLPIFFIILGFGDRARVAVIAIAAFFPLLISTSLAVQQINSSYFDVARVYKATTSQRVRQIILPSILPYIISGVRISFNNAFVVTMALEIVASPDGVGHVIWQSWELFRTEQLYASLFLIGLLSIINNLLFSFIENTFMPWKK